MTTGPRVIVTGGGSGIGAAAVAALTADGAHVVAVGRTPATLDAIASATGAVPVRLDVADLSAVGPAVADAVAVLGGLDALVNAAGIIRPGTLLDGDPQDWAAMFATNVVGAMGMTHHCLPHLLDSVTATVVNVSSTAGRRGATTGTGAYAATKQALDAVSDALRDELVGRGVRITTLVPGFVDTPMFDDVAADPVGAHLRQVAAGIGLDPTVVGRAIADVIALPPDREIPELVLVPTARLDGGRRG